jgi:hypothetical protein
MRNDVVSDAVDTRKQRQQPAVRDKAIDEAQGEAGIKQLLP